MSAPLLLEPADGNTDCRLELAVVEREKLLSRMDMRLLLAPCRERFLSLKQSGTVPAARAVATDATARPGAAADLENIIHASGTVDATLAAEMLRRTLVDA